MSETISTRCSRLQQLLSGKTTGKRVPMLQKEALLDALVAVYHECNNDNMMKDKNISTFVRKFKTVINEISNLRLSKGDFEIRKTIGRGHFGEVHVVREKVTGNVYAMKVLKKSETLSQDNVAFFEEERDIMAFANNPWITSLQYAFQDHVNLYLVMEYHPGGDLLILLSKFGDVLEEDMARFYLAEMFMAIHAVHTIGYVHRDIKPENVLIDRVGHVKLADFGSSAKLSSAKMVVSKMPVGTPEYIAPEVLTSMDGSGGKYGIECDWWSLGVCAYEMLAGNTPFEADSVVVVYSQIMNFKNSLQFPDDLTISDDAKSMIRGLLSDRTERLSYEQLANHNFFKGLDWTTLKDAVPPYVPALSSIDDTSNFDEFEAEPTGPRVEDFMKSKGGFSGKDLPFIGFTFTRELMPKPESASRQDSTGASSTCTTPTPYNSRGSIKSQEIKDSQQQIIAVKIELEKRGKELSELKLVSDNKDRQLNKLIDEKDLLDKEKILLGTEMKDLTSQLHAERTDRQKAEEEISKLVSEVQTISKKAEGLKEQELKVAVEEQNQVVAQLEQERLVALKKSQHLEQELNEHKKLLGESKTRIGELQAKLTKVNEDTKSNVSEVQAKLLTLTQDSENRVKELQEKLAKALSSAEEATEKFHNSEVEKKDLLKEIEQFKVSESEYKQKEAEEEIRRQELKQSAQRLEEDAKRKTDRIATLENETKGLKDDVQEAEMRYQKLSEVGEEMKSELNGKMKSLEDSLSTTKKEQKKLENDHKRLLQDLEQKTQTETTKDDTINDMKTSCQKLEEKVKDLMTDRDLNVKQKEEKMEGDIVEYRKQLSNLNSTISLLEKEKAALEYEVKSIKSDAASSESKAEEAEKRIEEVNAENTKRVGELQGSLVKAKDDAIRAQRDLHSTRRATDALQVKINSLQDEVISQKDAAEKAAQSKAVKQLEAKMAQTQKQLNETLITSKNQANKVKELTVELSREKKSSEEIKEEVKGKDSHAESQELTISMLKQTCTMLEGQVEELEVVNDEYQDREQQWAITKRQLYQAQERLESQLSESLHSFDSEKSSRIKSEEKVSTLEETLKEVREEMTNKVDQIEKINAEQAEKIKELNANLSENERKGALTTVTIKNLERRLETELDDKAKVQNELKNQSNLVASQKTSNFLLTQELEAAEEKYQEISIEREHLQNQIERTAYAQAEEKMRLESQLSQQTKLIDFLQAKVEEKGGKKKFGIRGAVKSSQQESTPFVSRKYKDLEQALEKEKNSNLQLHLQITKTREELQAARSELAVLKSLNRTSSMSAPTTPNISSHKKPEVNGLQQNITSSPKYTRKNSTNVTPGISPSTSVADLYFTSHDTEASNGKQRSTSNSPHKLQSSLNLRASKCPVCLNIVHFARQASKCNACHMVCHPKCAPSLSNMCGAPNDFLSIFKVSNKNKRASLYREETDSASFDAVDSGGLPRVEGWLKIPRKISGKQGWDRKWVELANRNLAIYDDENTIENLPIDTLDFAAVDCEARIHSAIPLSELHNTAVGEQPYAMAIDMISSEQIKPNRTVYFMAPTFADKQKWISALEFTVSLADKDRLHPLAKLDNRLSLLDSKERINATCGVCFGEALVIGNDDGLFYLRGSQATLIPGVNNICQLKSIDELGIVLLISGKERQFNRMDLKDVKQRIKHASSNTSKIVALNPKNNERIKTCHYFVTGKIDGEHYACAALPLKLVLLRFNSGMGTFVVKKEIETNESCTCVSFTSTGLIYGTTKFYSFDIKQGSVKEFLDSSDTSLAYAVFGTTQSHSFPVGIFSTGDPNGNEEFLLCFSDFGVFVDPRGCRSRPSDFKWSRLPLQFAYRPPYLYSTHFNSFGVCRIPSDTSIDVSTYSWEYVDIPSPRYLGNAEAPGAILLATLSKDRSAAYCFSGTNSIALVANGNDVVSELRSSSGHSISSDEETSRKIARGNTVSSSSPSVSKRKVDPKRENRASFRMPFSFKAKRFPQAGD